MRYNIFLKTILLFFLNGHILHAMTAQLAIDRCKASMNQVKYPQNHSYIETIKLLKSIIQKKVDLIEKAASSNILTLLADCMDGVSALEWIAKQKAPEDTKNNETETTTIEKTN